MHWLLRHNHGRKLGFAKSLFDAYFASISIALACQNHIPPESAYAEFVSELGYTVGDGSSARKLPSTYKRLPLTGNDSVLAFRVGRAQQHTVGEGDDAVFNNAVIHLPNASAMLYPGCIVSRFGRLFLNGALYTSDWDKPGDAGKRDSRTFVYVDMFKREVAAIASCFFYSPATNEAFCVARELTFEDGPALNNRVYGCMFFADKNHDNGPVVTINVAAIRRRLIRLDFPGLRFRDRDVVALVDYVYAVPGTENIRIEHDQRQQHEQM
jgi:hypothetical protein